MNSIHRPASGAVQPLVAAPARGSLRRAIASVIVPLAAWTVAATPADAAVFAYVPNTSNSTASAIDTSTQTQTALIPGVGTTYSAAVAPNGTLAYVVSFSGNTVFPINTTTNVLGTAIAVGTNPVNVTFSADSSKAYVSNYGANTISVIDVVAGTVTTTVAAVCGGGGARPLQSVFNGAKLLIVCNAAPSTIRVMDTAAGNALSTLATVGNTAYNIAISMTSGFAYVTNYGADTVSKVDLTSGATTTFPTTGVTNPLGVAVMPDGSKIYIASYSNSNMIVMNPAGVISSTINLGANSAGIGRSSTGSVLYVPARGLAAGIKVVDTATDTVLSTIANPGANPGAIWGDFLGNVAAAPTPGVNGTCGVVAATSFKPTGGALCSSGTLNAAGVVRTGSNWTWACDGSGAGTSTAANACSAPLAATSTGTGGAAGEVAGGAWQFAPSGTGPTQTSGFIGTTGHVKSPPTLPPGVTFPHGLFDFVLTTGVAGSAATVTLTFPSALPAGTAYWKYGPTAGNTAPHWYQFPGAVIAGNTVTLTVTDGLDGDDDLAANSIILDAGGPGVGGGAAVVETVPTLSEWAMILLTSLVALFGLTHVRRQQQRRP